MISLFNRHRAAFESLRDVIRAEGARTGAEVGWDRGRDKAPDARVRGLIEELDLEQVDGGFHGVTFTAFSFGLSVSGSFKAYVWTRTPPKLILESLDPPFDRSGWVTDTWFRAHRRIAPDWYLYYSRS